LKEQCQLWLLHPKATSVIEVETVNSPQGTPLTAGHPNYHLREIEIISAKTSGLGQRLFRISSLSTILAILSNPVRAKIQNLQPQYHKNPKENQILTDPKKPN
jgi:hypothetical protein